EPARRPRLGAGRAPGRAHDGDVAQRHDAHGGEPGVQIDRARPSPGPGRLAGLRALGDRMKILIHLLLSAVAVFAAANVLPGVKVDSFQTALIVAVALGVVNAFLKPILYLLTLPINIMTLGLFTFVIVGGCVLLV